MSYEFTQEGYRNFSQAIIDAKGDQATLTTILADMQTTFENSIGTLATSNKNLEDTQAENTRLKEANMNLFLRIGEPQQNQPPQNTPNGADKPPMNCEQFMEEYFKEDNPNGK